MEIDARALKKLVALAEIKEIEAQMESDDRISASCAQPPQVVSDVESELAAMEANDVDEPNR